MAACGCGYRKSKSKTGKVTAVLVRVCDKHRKRGVKAAAKPATKYRDQSKYHEKYKSAVWRSQAANRARKRAKNKAAKEAQHKRGELRRQAAAAKRGE